MSKRKFVDRGYYVHPEADVNYEYLEKLLSGRPKGDRLKIIAHDLGLEFYK